jgi:O-methyltransferase
MTTWNRIGRGIYRRIARLLSHGDPIPHGDPTQLPPPAYTRERADFIYGEAFRRCFEYVSGTGVVGDILEFGTYRGYTARLMAGLIKEFRLDGTLYLFDSFEGLPAIDSPVDQQSYEVAANKAWFHGQMATHDGIVDQIRRGIAGVLPDSRFRVIKGYYEDTLDANLLASKAAVVHIDCDLYSSTRSVLDRLLARDQFQDGCVMICDDYNCNRASPRMGERQALVDAFGRQDRYTYSPWFSYGWHGQIFFVHDNAAALEALAEEPVANREAWD